MKLVIAWCFKRCGDVGKIARLLADWYPKAFQEIQTGKPQAITTRSGKDVKSPQLESKSDDLPIVQELKEAEQEKEQSTSLKAQLKRIKRQNKKKNNLHA